MIQKLVDMTLLFGVDVQMKVNYDFALTFLWKSVQMCK